jgi:hypothetical protein
MLHDRENLVMYGVLYPKAGSMIFDGYDGEPAYRLSYFVVTDLSSDYLPWDYIVDQGIYMEMVASRGSLPHDFIREEPMRIYLTYNLWTCRCRRGNFIHDVGNPFCTRCRTYHRGLKDRRNFFHTRRSWRASIDIYPYWHERAAMADPRFVLN